MNHGQIAIGLLGVQLSEAKKILGLHRFDGLEGLKRRFHQLAHQYHPDKNDEQNAVEKFRAVMDAYQCALENISELYEEFHLKQEPGLKEKASKIVVENINDIFEDIFGFSKSERILGYHEPQIIWLTLKEFMCGVQKRKKLVAYKKCETCVGIGARAGTSAKICTHCFGQGFIKKPKRVHFKRKPCPKCLGRGRQVMVPCTDCNGFGRLRQFHIQEFSIPVGMLPYQVYTLESFDVQTKSKANLFLELKPLRDPIFQIDKYDLLCEYHTDLTEQARQRVVMITTPAGKEKLVIPAHAKNGDVLAVFGAGMYQDSTKQKRGDLRVTLRDKKRSWFKRIFGGLFGKN